VLTLVSLNTPRLLIAKLTYNLFVEARPVAPGQVQEKPSPSAPIVAGTAGVPTALGAPSAPDALVPPGAFGAAGDAGVAGVPGALDANGTLIAPGDPGAPVAPGVIGAPALSAHPCKFEYSLTTVQCSHHIT
jgi:hypothetical protein